MPFCTCYATFAVTLYIWTLGLMRNSDSDHVSDLGMNLFYLVAIGYNSINHSIGVTVIIHYVEQSLWAGSDLEPYHTSWILSFLTSCYLLLTDWHTVRSDGALDDHSNVISTLRVSCQVTHPFKTRITPPDWKSAVDLDIIQDFKGLISHTQLQCGR